VSLIPEGAKRAARRYVEEIRNLPRAHRTRAVARDGDVFEEEAWAPLDDIMLQAKAELNRLCVELHPEDRALMAEQLAASCAATAVRIRAYNDQHGVPERANRGMKPHITPKIQ
jgi:hypothetical protein